MRLGKLSNENLEKLVLNHFESRRKEVLLPPGIGLDCSVLDLGDSLCVLSSDPITGSAENLGMIAVHVCCNDAAAAGADPIGVMTTLLLPPEIDEEKINKIAYDIAEASKAAGVDVLGGHTEITDAVTRPILSATVLAKLPLGKELIHSGGLREGDALIMSKWAAIEGTLIIAADFASRLGSTLSDEEFANIASWAKDLSVVDEGRIASNLNAHALHDVTEGGILGAAWEMAEASKLGLEIYKDKIKIKTETAKICKMLALDPYRLIASGSMLIGCENGEEMLEALRKEKIEAQIIGRVLPKHKGVFMDNIAVLPPESDELWRLF